MIVFRARPVLSAGIVVGILAVALPAFAAARADRVRDWLAELAASAAADGHRLSWGEVSTSLFGGDVTVRNLRSVDRGGRQRLAVASLTVEELRTDSAVPTAKAVLLEGAAFAGADIARMTVDRIEIGEANLEVVGEMLEMTIAGDAEPDAGAWTRLSGDRLELANLHAESAGAGGPFSLQVGRMLLAGLVPGGSGRLEADDLRMAGTADDGEPMTISVAEVRADDIGAGSAARALTGDPLAARPFSVLAGLQVGMMEMKDFRTESETAGSTEIDRQWFRTKVYTPGRAGVLQFGSEGMRSRPAGAPGPISPIMQSLFPPDGQVVIEMSGDVSYDVDSGFVGYRQEMAVDGFGSFNMQADFSGLPDLSVAEWQTVKKGDPRLAALQINAISLSVTDSGGLDRTVAALASDKSVPAAKLRQAVAEQIGAFVQNKDGSTDPSLLRWVTAVQDFVRLGGTLAFGVTKPIPLGEVREQRIEVKSLSDLAERYGLAVVRR